jgi:energy-converting hydrogenase Eha subunit G
MSTLDHNISNIRAKNPIDILIYEDGLRIKNVVIDRELDLIGVILNNGKIIEDKISFYPLLKNANEKQLNNWRLISGGIGISWEEINEDLSLKGFIETAAINEMLEHLQINKIKA